MRDEELKACGCNQNQMCPECLPSNTRPAKPASSKYGESHSMMPMQDLTCRATVAPKPAENPLDIPAKFNYDHLYDEAPKPAEGVVAADSDIIKYAEMVLRHNTMGHETGKCITTLIAQNKAQAETIAGLVAAMEKSEQIDLDNGKEWDKLKAENKAQAEEIAELKIIHQFISEDMLKTCTERAKKGGN